MSRLKRIFLLFSDVEYVLIAFNIHEPANERRFKEQTDALATRQRSWITRLSTLNTREFFLAKEYVYIYHKYNFVQFFTLPLPNLPHKEPNFPASIDLSTNPSFDNRIRHIVSCSLYFVAIFFSPSLSTPISVFNVKFLNKNIYFCRYIS